MPGIIRRILAYRVSVGFLTGFLYLLVGVIWSTTRAEHVQHLHGADLKVSSLGSILSWPVLLFSDVRMT